jgi:hypothetical protein
MREPATCSISKRVKAEAREKMRSERIANAQLPAEERR